MNRTLVMQLVECALRAVDPACAVRNALKCQDDILTVGEQTFNLADARRILVAGGGKAGAPMSHALTDLLGPRFTAGWVNVKQGHLVDTVLPTGMVIHEARHPIPDESGRVGTERMLDLIRDTQPADIVFCLISGGGSALMPLPVQGITLSDLQTLTQILLGCGATINEINTIRKHCSQFKGGQLARAAYPATVISLILSDVVGNPLDVIASGPTVPDPTTFADAWAILRRYQVVDQVPENIVRHLQAGIAGTKPETPKPGDPIFERVTNVIIGSNAIAARAAQAHAQAMGFNTLLLSTYIEGEAREVAQVMGGIAKSLITENLPLLRPACIIAGGETTVTLRGDGLGGRNQELALAAALAIEGWQGITVATLATDGTDGPTDAAGAIVDGSTVRRAQALALSARDVLDRNDSYAFFNRLGDLIRTGPTNTNVNDLIFVLAE